MITLRISASGGRNIQPKVSPGITANSLHRNDAAYFVISHNSRFLFIFPGVRCDIDHVCFCKKVLITCFNSLKGRTYTGFVFFSLTFCLVKKEVDSKKTCNMLCARQCMLPSVLLKVAFGFFNMK